MINTDVENAISHIFQGKIIILVDDKNRENEGDFIQSSECVTPESINFMITHGRGLLCQALTSSRAIELDLDWQVQINTSLHATKFTVSVDAKNGTTTGISVYDRSKTIQCLVDSTTRPEDLARPGHIFPIIAHEGGILARAGHTEGSIELARLAGKKDNAVLCEILNKDGGAANLQELLTLADTHDLALLHIKDLIKYIQEHNYERSNAN